MMKNDLNEKWQALLQATLDHKMTFVKIEFNGEPMDLIATVDENGFNPYAVLLSDTEAKILGAYLNQAQLKGDVN